MNTKPESNLLLNVPHLEVLRVGRGGPPVVLVGWADIADALQSRLSADVPVWWLKADAIDLRPPFFVPPICETTAALADELLHAAPSGRLILVGYSFGGLLAFDVARLLRKVGRLVQVLLAEPVTPGLSRASESRSPETPTERLRRHSTALKSLEVSRRLTYVSARALGVMLSLWVRSQKRLLWSYLRLRLALGAYIPPEQAWFYFLRQIYARINEYRPVPCPGPIHLAGTAQWLEAYAPAWQSLVEGPVVPCPAPLASTHDDLFRLPAAAAWIDLVREWSSGPAATSQVGPVEASGAASARR